MDRCGSLTVLECGSVCLAIGSRQRLPGQMQRVVGFHLRLII